MTEISMDHASGRLAPIPRPAVTARDFTYLVLGLPLGIATLHDRRHRPWLAAGLLITPAARSPPAPAISPGRCCADHWPGGAAPYLNGR